MPRRAGDWVGLRRVDTCEQILYLVPPATSVKVSLIIYLVKHSWSEGGMVIAIDQL
jgi:hypothetical protein